MPPGGIAAQRHDVADADLVIAVDDLVDLAARGADAGQMRGRQSAGLAAGCGRWWNGCARGSIRRRHRSPRRNWATSGASRLMVSHRLRSISSVFGGKNSKEIAGDFARGAVGAEA